MIDFITELIASGAIMIAPKDPMIRITEAVGVFTILKITNSIKSTKIKELQKENSALKYKISLLIEEKENEYESCEADVETKIESMSVPTDTNSITKEDVVFERGDRVDESSDESCKEDYDSEETIDSDTLDNLLSSFDDDEYMEPPERKKAVKRREYKNRRKQLEK